MFRIPKSRIAIVGGGISGLGAAWLLADHHEVTVFEANRQLGGHANTVNVATPGGTIPVDTGFIVCNDRNYPNFLALLDAVDIQPHPTDMSFGISMDKGGFEYAGSDNLSDLLAQPSNLFRPRFWSMIRSLLRFYRETSHLDTEHLDAVTLRQYLDREGYSHSFLRDHILPMAAAVWSTPSDQVGDFPLKSFLRFCQNHGLLEVNNRPQWYTISGGSRRYVDALAEATNAHFVTGAPVDRIERSRDGATICHGGKQEKFDQVLIATHADTALAMLADTDERERNLLTSFTYARNRAVLHSDTRFMPRRKRAWASWNYIQPDSNIGNELSVTYWMNRLQPLNTETPFLLTLNPAEDIDPDLVHFETEYDHPIFDMNTLQAQMNMGKIMGHRKTWYAGAHFGYGFHEDGLQSGLYAAEQMTGLRRPWILPEMNSRILMLNSGVNKGPEGAAA